VVGESLSETRENLPTLGCSATLPWHAAGQSSTQACDDAPPSPHTAWKGWEAKAILPPKCGSKAFNTRQSRDQQTTLRSRTTNTRSSSTTKVARKTTLA